MYTLEERLLAVNTYYKMGRNATATVRRLGYPDVSNLTRWVKEYEREQSLHRDRVRYSRYTESEKQAAVDYYFANGQNVLQTVKALEYPSRPLLSQWVSERQEEEEKACKKRKAYENVEKNNESRPCWNSGKHSSCSYSGKSSPWSGAWISFMIQ